MPERFMVFTQAFFEDKWEMATLVKQHPDGSIFVKLDSGGYRFYKKEEMVEKIK